jgi:2,3-bisphosphoglycerate-independent phosphoglycerate mutase
VKTLIVVAGGAADRPQEELGGRTPLEAADVPSLDRIAREGRLGRVVPVAPGQRAEEGAFALALFGIDPAAHPDAGGALEAAAFEVPVGSLDQVFRLALVTAHEDTVFDPTAGHVSREEGRMLLDALSEGLADPEFVFLLGDGWRNLLVWRGARDVRVQTVPPYEVVGKSLRAAMPRGTGTARLHALIARSAEILATHEVNECRTDLHENPATLAWPWGGGVSTSLPSLRSRVPASAAFVGVSPSFVGAARLQGVEVVPVPGATGKVDTNFRAKTDAALRALATHDLVFLHVDAATEASHSRDFHAKVEALERLDGYVVAPAVREVEAQRDTRLVVIAGEAVAVDSGRHLPDAVPFAIYGPGVRSHRGNAFSEVAAREGGFCVERSHELLDFLLKLT